MFSFIDVVVVVVVVIIVGLILAQRPVVCVRAQSLRDHFIVDLFFFSNACVSKRMSVAAISLNGCNHLACLVFRFLHIEFFFCLFVPERKSVNKISKHLLQPV